MGNARNTSESRLIGVYGRDDRFLGIKKRGQALEYEQILGGGVGRSANLLDVRFAQNTPGANVGKTFEHTRAVKMPFSGGRLIAYSSGAAQAAGVLQAAVSTKAAYNSASAAAPVAVTWNGATSPGGGGVFSASPGANQLNIGLSDPFVLQSAARTDGGTGGILAIRAEAAAAGAFLFSLRAGPSNGVQYAASADNVDYTQEAVGAYVSANQAGYAAVATTPANGNLMIFDAVLFTTSRIISVANFGDSLEQGQYGLFGSENDVKKACDQLTIEGAGNIVYCGGSTMPSRGVASYAYRALQVIERLRTDAAVYQLWSPNDGAINTAAAVAISRAYLCAVIEACVRSGTALTVKTPPLWKLFDAAAHAAALAYHAEIKALCDSLGLQFLDAYQMTADVSVSPPVLLPGYGYPTGSAAEQAHLAAPGYDAITPATKVALKASMGL
jgi:hypothetical protein